MVLEGTVWVGKIVECHVCSSVPSCGSLFMGLNVVVPGGYPALDVLGGP